MTKAEVNRKATIADACNAIARLEEENAKLRNRNAELKGMYAHSAREAETYKQFLELKEKENAELRKELKEWKDEWQEQVQKATDEGYARTLQTMQLSKAKEIIKTFLAIVNNDVEYVQNPQDCKDLWKELCEKAKQFLSEVENDKRRT